MDAKHLFSDTDEKAERLLVALARATPEDTIIAKLNWYRLGNEVSDRQWQDVMGVIKVQGDRLDLSYLRQWAKILNVFDLLEKALAQAQSDYQ